MNPETDPVHKSLNLPTHLFIVTAVVMVLLLTIIGLLLYQNTLLKQQLGQSPSLPPDLTLQESPVLYNSPVTDPTANWKTYTSKMYKFSLQYPSEWLIIDNSRGIVEPQPRSISIGAINMEPQKWVSTRLKTDAKEITLDSGENSITVLRVSGVKSYFTQEYALISISSGSLIFQGYIGGSASELTQQTNEFDQIIATFRFVDQNNNESKIPCVTGGCSGELCYEKPDAPEKVPMTACVYKNEYECLGKTRCERQSNGVCGWTDTPEYKKCMEKFKN